MKYEKLATDLMFSKVATAELAPVYGLQFRKGKTADDIANAIKKAKKNGHAKVEFELSMLEVYLKKLLKKA
jgi:hypothetical protein